MRALLLVIILLCQGLFTQAQQLDEKTLQLNASYDAKLGQSYLKKSRTHKIIGFSLLGTGFLATVGGIIVSESYWNSENDLYYDLGPAMAGVGLSMMVSSIPLFIIGAKNKGRAEVLLHDQKIFGRGAGIPQRIPAIGIGIPLQGR